MTADDRSTDEDVDGADTDGAEEDAGAADRTAPLADVAARVDRRRTDDERTPSRSPDFDDLFEQEPVGEIDGDRLREQLGGEPLPEVIPTTDSEVREISKRSYCHQCEYFTDPPEVGCTNEGTTILELVSMDTFRVANCPVVLEEETLEERT